MNFRILRKDLTKKKTIHIILVIFILLATTFIAGSLNNLLGVWNGTDDYMEMAELPDYMMLSIDSERRTITENDKVALELLETSEHVLEYAFDEMLGITGTNLELENGKNIDMGGNAGYISPYNIKQQKFFTTEDEMITEVEDGSIYVIRKVQDSYPELEVGDKIYLNSDGYSKEFTVAGFMKDAFLGSGMMGNYRYIVSEADYEEIAENTNLETCKIYSVWSDDIQGFINELNESSFASVFNAKQSLVKVSYVMDLIVAAVFMIISICLVIISVLMLRFTIIFTINENYKEIGIMKAIGMKDSAIRRIYMTKYFVLACIGATFGFVASIFFSDFLLEQSTKNLIMKSTENGIWLQLVASIVLVFVVTGFAYLGTAKIKKMTPLIAIRSGDSGERFTKKGILKLVGTKKKATTFLALNDVFSDWKKYVVLILTSLVGIWLVAMPVNTINTLNSENSLSWFNLKKSDFFVLDEAGLMEVVTSGEKEYFEKKLDEIADVLEDNGYEVEKTFMETTFRIKLYCGENSYECHALQGVRTNMEDYEYTEGTAPKYENEIALTHVVANALGAKIGDTVYVLNGDEKEPFIVSAIYQSMMNMGESVRFSEKTNLSYSLLAGYMGMQFVLEEDANLEEIEEIIVEKYPELSVESPKEYVDTMIGGVINQLTDMKIWIVVIVIIINVLVVSLMQKMFLTKERGQIAMLKSIGFSNGSIMLWQAKRIMFVLFVGILLGTATGSFFSQLTAGNVFKFMGLSAVEFEINALEVYVIYPVVVFVSTVIACFVSMYKVRDISEKEMNDIE